MIRTRLDIKSPASRGPLILLRYERFVGLTLRCCWDMGSGKPFGPVRDIPNLAASECTFPLSATIAQPD
jgi:hypothetical protein